MKYFVNKTKYIFLLVLAISFFGCEEDDEANLPQVVAGFTFTQVPNTGAVSFINISEEAQRFEWDFGNGETSTEINPIRVFEEGTFTVTLTAMNIAGASDIFEDQITVVLPEPEAGFDSGLLSNGDFSNGGESWIGNALNVVTEGGNSFNLATVETAGNPFDVNLSQIVEIVQGTNYILTFDASSDRARTILAGIGLNEAPFTNTAPMVNLTTDTQTFMLQLSAADFGGANSRILFDLGAEVGTVVIDNVSLVEGGDGSDSAAGDDGGDDMMGGDIPTEAAPTPTQDAANVTSVFSNAYTNVEGTNPRAFGNDGGATFSEIQVEDDDVWSYAATNFVGLQNDGGFDGRTNFSMDVWVAEDVPFRAGLISFTDPVSREDVEVNLTGGQWTTIDVALADLVQSLGNEGPLPDAPTINQIIFDVLGDGVEADIFVDNVFFYTAESESEGSLVACDGGELVNDFETADDSIFNNFGGGVGTIIDNPDTSVNTSARISQYVKNAGEVFGGITIEVDPDIDFNAGVFSIDVNSQAVRQLLFKLEGLNIETIVPTSGAGWETITYDFSQIAGNIGTATAITLIMDNGTAGDGSADFTIQFDNIRLCSNETSDGTSGLEICDGGELVNDFETADDSIFNNFGGGVGTIIDNPDTSINISARIGQYVKNAGEVFGGITIEVDPDIDFNAGVFSIDVNSQAVRQLLFKLEGLNIETIVPTSGAGWETITYDFSQIAGNIGTATAITLIMDNGTAGDGSADFTIQFDNIRLCSNGSSDGDMDGSSGCTTGAVAATVLPLDFEGCESFVSAFSSIGDGGVIPSLTANPSQSGINTSDNVLRVVRASGINRWGGVQNSFPQGVIDITTQVFRIKVFSSLPDVTYRFELALDPQTEPVTGNPAPVFRQVSGGANTWTEIEFTFTNLPATPTTYNQLVIKPDNPEGSDGDTTSEEQVFYFDDLRLE